MVELPSGKMQTVLPFADQSRVVAVSLAMELAAAVRTTVGFAAAVAVTAAGSSNFVPPHDAREKTERKAAKNTLSRGGFIMVKDAPGFRRHGRLV